MAEKISLRVPVDSVEVEVNDNGDVILLNVGDERFMQKLYDFSMNVSERARELSETPTEDIKQAIELDIEFHTWLKEQFDELFGDKSYEKVFGKDIVVGSEFVLEFLDNILPVIQKYTDKRVAKFNKYSADRVGSSL